ncbi:hypothetical protein [Cupriavidus oxalaticus]|uniref:Uncharacterized protein n=1 Tax=Cupriavidus oxalaticus TaxID=96344 RepID=A0A4P7LI01_9BURK|nr:hypothetical protein [Cupriavidus oxalaticus]QBY55864.1 hypothetical protein E0W60_33480 [Cupriavidus oxalaticus]
MIEILIHLLSDRESSGMPDCVLPGESRLRTPNNLFTWTGKTQFNAARHAAIGTIVGESALKLATMQHAWRC